MAWRFVAENCGAVEFVTSVIVAGRDKTAELRGLFFHDLAEPRRWPGQKKHLLKGATGRNPRNMVWGRQELNVPAGTAHIVIV